MTMSREMGENRASVSAYAHGRGEKQKQRETKGCLVLGYVFSVLPSYLASLDGSTMTSIELGTRG